ncbi:MAG: hypothetical protein K2H59_03335 [Muribaculaceae bacterium]|nr:hypothetical protein [Muribaculaceae bacterium]
MKRYFCLIAFILGLFLCVDINAQKKIEDDMEHNRIIFSAATTSDTYLLEMGYHYMFSNYVGVGGTFGFWKVSSSGGRASGKGWWVDDDYNDPSNIYIKPSVILKSPQLSIFSLYAEPGIMLNVPYQKAYVELTDQFPHCEYERISTNKGQWLALELRAGISADFSSFGITLGYLMSNLDPFSMYRHMSYNGVSFQSFYRKKSFRQGAFISASFSF